MLDQLIINGVSSLDYGASVAERKISKPTKKSIKETVPHSNATYDFSAINGELYWNERILEYALEVMADTPQKLSEMLIALCSWLMNVAGAEIVDPFIDDYHFTNCTYEDMDTDDDESGEKTTLTVKFTAYPYLVADNARAYQAIVPANTEKVLTVVNESCHLLTPTIETDGAVSIGFKSTEYTIGTAGTYTEEEIKMSVGVNDFTLTNTTDADVTVTVSFHEEVFI